MVLANDPLVLKYKIQIVVPSHGVLVGPALASMCNVPNSINKGCYYYDPRMP